MTTTKHNETHEPDMAQAHKDNDKHAAKAPASPPGTESEFKLGKPGSKDYVAGQPIDEAELAKVTAEDDKKKAAAKEAADKAAKESTARETPKA